MVRWRVALAKTPSPLRSAGAVHDASVTRSTSARPIARELVTDVVEFGHCCGSQSRAPKRGVNFEDQSQDPALRASHKHDAQYT